MRRYEYCILNKQYTKEEYHAIRSKIIDHMMRTGEWGDFFQPEISLFAYNETTAQEWYPLNENEAFKLGYNWQQNLPGSFKKETIQWAEVPDFIEAINSDGTFGTLRIVWNEIFSCIECRKNFKIQKPEFFFYKKCNIPLPRYCVDCRYNNRKALMPPRRLFERRCTCQREAHGHVGRCSSLFQTPYAPERPEIVYCEKCYLETVY